MQYVEIIWILIQRKKLYKQMYEVIRNIWHGLDFFTILRNNYKYLCLFMELQLFSLKEFLFI